MFVSVIVCPIDMLFPSSTGAECSGRTRHVHSPYPHHGPDSPVAQGGLHQSTADEARYSAPVAHPPPTPQMNAWQPTLLGDTSFSSNRLSFSQESLHHTLSPFNVSHTHPSNSFVPQPHYTSPSGIDPAQTYFIDQLISQVKIGSSAKCQLFHEVANSSMDKQVIAALAHSMAMCEEVDALANKVVEQNQTLEKILQYCCEDWKLDATQDSLINATLRHFLIQPAEDYGLVAVP
ncbi:uncharacterized protein PHACADRAFT_179801 [Phanerochaete carnosa HHB-10118-sp]|uniref:Uncharacterized protein n=1 Tax=Phanerochaete carnosa (strain HHB-10118-sp) TaxID=650164 RepID=K5W9C5_PHACS|nr:uncharacterized protein PHACADRAFT_179801 [Phanerochaete carnosa HHB-10118-sp]EKM60558.1 hypothetical protein PHACADRAFT_179801 [Phanerochaete carnosa HHB-10118-sp]